MNKKQLFERLTKYAKTEFDIFLSQSGDFSLDHEFDEKRWCRFLIKASLMRKPIVEDISEAFIEMGIKKKYAEDLNKRFHEGILLLKICRKWSY